VTQSINQSKTICIAPPANSGRRRLTIKTTKCVVVNYRDVENSFYKVVYRILQYTVCECSVGCVLVFLHVVNVISAFTKCYPVNDQEYCFYTDGSVLSWDDAREFCESRDSTLPIITDEDIDNVFQRFISDSNNTNNYVWLDAHAQHVHTSDQLHWINGQPSG